MNWLTFSVFFSLASKLTMRVAVLLMLCGILLGHHLWVKADRFDEVLDRINSINAINCAVKDAEELKLPSGIISDPIGTHRQSSRPASPLLSLHQTVLSNALKYSYMFRRINQTYNFMDQPGLFYYYLSLIADVTANPGHLTGQLCML